MMKIVVAFISGAIGAFLGTVSGLPGQIAGGVSGIIVGYLYTEKMIGLHGHGGSYYRQGIKFGMLAGFVSGFIAHIPRLIMDYFGIFKGTKLFFINGWSLIIWGAIFGTLVGLVFGLVLSLIFNHLPSRKDRNVNQKM